MKKALMPPKRRINRSDYLASRVSVSAEELGLGERGGQTAKIAISYGIIKICITIFSLRCSCNREWTPHATRIIEK